jgi:transposase-like protein
MERHLIYSDGWRAYAELVLNGYKCYRIHHYENEFARKKNYINGIESFWGFGNVQMYRFKGIHWYMFYLHLKECEF